jgi:hypothetical protein
MMQSERFTPRVHLIPTLASDNEEFGREDDEVALDQDSGRNRRLFPSGVFLLSMAALGVTLALIWRNVDGYRWSNVQLWPTFSAQPAQSTSNSELEQQIARLVQEVDALKKNVSELGAGQQQIAARIASLQASQRAVYWYGSPVDLMYPLAAAQRPGSLAPPKQSPTARARPEAQEAR